MFGKQNKENKELKIRLGELQSSVDILTNKLEVESRKYKGNSYNTYLSMVTEIANKYDGVSDWGNQIVKNIIDVRAAFIIGQGIIPLLKRGYENFNRELEFIQEFIDYNNLDEEISQDWAKESEIEGKALIRILPNIEDQMIEARFIPFTTHHYNVITPEEDYEDYLNVKYKVKKVGREITLQSHEFVYKKFGGRIDKVNETPPKVGVILNQCENLDKCLWDWRKSDFFFGHPTPYFKCLNKDEALTMREYIEKMNWKIGKALVGTADFTFVTPNTEGINALEKEIITNAKIISGATGCPVHFLGLPDLMSNRATAENLMELIYASTNKERKVWKGCYEELFEKVLTMANESFQQNYEVNAVECSIAFVTVEQLKLLIDVWLPLYMNNVITLDTMLSKIPEIDIGREKEEIEKQENKKAIQMLNHLKSIENQNTDNVNPNQQEGKII